MMTMKIATARHPVMGPISPPKESALRASRLGLFTSSSTWLCASAGTAGTMFTTDSSPIDILGAERAVARALCATRVRGFTATHEGTQESTNWRDRVG